MSEHEDAATQLANRLIDEILAEEQAKLNGPACADGEHTVKQRKLYRAEGWYLDDTYGSCSTCERTLSRRDVSSPWVVSCGSGCECRECRARWSKPTDAPPRFAMSAVSEGTLVTMDAAHHCGAGGLMGGGAQGCWRVTSLWRPLRKEDNVWPIRHEGQNLVPCCSAEATHVSMYAVCGVMLRTDDFQAHATIDGHIDQP